MSMSLHKHSSGNGSIKHWHNCFATRVTTDTDGHIHAFAAEMFNVDVVLQVFIEYVLQPAVMLGEQCTCMGYMRTVLGILRLQDGALQYLPELRTALRNHHTLFLRLYPNLAKPKLHYMWHVCDCLERFAANMSCFSPERRHKQVKGIAKHTFAYIEQHVLSKLLNNLVNDLQAKPQDVQRSLSRAVSCHPLGFRVGAASCP